MPGSFEKLQKLIQYQFNDLSILRQALTHKSHSATNNERLEFVGDAVLGYLVGVDLYNNFQHLQEDNLSLMRSKLVRGTTLAEIANEINLGEYLLVGEGERKSGGRKRASVLANALEALIGAVHQDGGIEPCQKLVTLLFAQRMHQIDLAQLKDAKTQLQELLQSKKMKLPIYQVEQTLGEEHSRVYEVSCSISEQECFTLGSASSRREAEKLAASQALQILAEKGLT